MASSREIQQSVTISSSDDGDESKMDLTQNENSYSEPQTNGNEYVFLPGRIGRYPNEPNCLMTTVEEATSVVTINFSSNDPILYGFTEELLTDNFAYFKASLSFDEIAGHVHEQVEVKHFILEDVTSQDFGRIFTYLERKARNGIRYTEPFLFYKPEAIHDILQAVIAADFLGLEDFKLFEEYMAERLAYALIMDRLILNAAVLVLITTHGAFRSGIFWDVCVKAAVRPSLVYYTNTFNGTLSRLYYDVQGSGFASEYTGRRGWAQIRNHYAELRQSCAWYDDEVKQAIQETLETLHPSQQTLKRHGVLDVSEGKYNDPLYDITVAVTVLVPGPAFQINKLHSDSGVQL